MAGDFIPPPPLPFSSNTLASKDSSRWWVVAEVALPLGSPLLLCEISAPPAVLFTPQFRLVKKLADSHFLDATLSHYFLQEFGVAYAWFLQYTLRNQNYIAPNFFVALVPSSPVYLLLPFLHDSGI